MRLTPFLSNGRCASRGDLDKLAPRMRPTIGELNVGIDAVRCYQPIISRVAVNLNDAREPLQYPFSMLPATAGREVKATPDGAPPPEGRSSWPKPSSIRSWFYGNRDQPSTGARISSMNSLAERFRSAIQASNRPQFESCPTHPMRKRGAVEIDALTALI